MKPLDQYPTPETDAAQFHRDSGEYKFNDMVVTPDVAQSLERRLAACREALEQLLAEEHIPMSMRVASPTSIIRETLAATAKP